MDTETNIKIKLSGEDGNAFAILGRVAQALREKGYADLASKFLEEATSGDYDHLLLTAAKYVEVS